MVEVSQAIAAALLHFVRFVDGTQHIEVVAFQQPEQVFFSLIRANLILLSKTYCDITVLA
jgi:hypothetical protein